MSTSTALHTEDANSAREQLEAVIEDHAQIANNSPLLMVVHWVVAVLHLLLVFIDSAVSELIARIDDAEESSTSGGAPSAIGDTAATRATAPPSSTAAARSRQRCDRCHARGHSTATCLTHDPTAMRKQVAGNQRARKQAHSKSTPVPFNTPFPYPPLPYAGMITSPPPPPSMAAELYTDAEELRRRRRQSARDRRKHRAAKDPSEA